MSVLHFQQGWFQLFVLEESFLLQAESELMTLMKSLVNLVRQANGVLVSKVLNQGARLTGPYIQTAPDTAASASIMRLNGPTYRRWEIHREATLGLHLSGGFRSSADSRALSAFNTVMSVRL